MIAFCGRVPMVKDMLRNAVLPVPRQSPDACANALVLPLLAVASLMGFGAVVGDLPTFAAITGAVLSIEGGTLAGATNVVAGLAGTASGGMATAVSSLGDISPTLAQLQGTHPLTCIVVLVVAVILGSVFGSSRASQSKFSGHLIP